jgi:hypothetical protein
MLDQEVYGFGTISNHSVEEKNAWNSVQRNANSRNSFPKHSTTFEVRTNDNVKLFWLFLENNFFCVFPFRSIPSFGIDSSMDFRMPRNEHFLPRNNGNRSESIPQNCLE